MTVIEVQSDANSGTSDINSGLFTDINFEFSAKELMVPFDAGSVKASKSRPITQMLKKCQHGHRRADLLTSKCAGSTS